MLFHLNSRTFKHTIWETTITKLHSHTVKLKERKKVHHNLAFPEQKGLSYATVKIKGMMKLWQIPWQCPFKVITYYGKSAFTSINLFLYNSLPSDIWFLPNESVFKSKVIKLKQWEWLSNPWPGAVLAINKSTLQYPETSYLPLFIYFISFSAPCISYGANT